MGVALRWRGGIVAACCMVICGLFAPMVMSGAPLPACGAAVEPSPAIPSDFKPSDEIEVYGNFETAGVIALVPQGLTADGIGRMRGFLNVGGQWRPVHDLVQVGRFPWFATSVFWLRPGGQYQVKVVVESPSGQVLATWYGQGATRAEPALKQGNDCLYVSPGGDDANPGSPEKPFKTLGHACQIVKAGQTVLVRAGTYYEGQLQFANDGQDQAPIALRAYPGEKVVIDGSDPDLLDAGGWTASPDGVYSHAFAGASSHGVVVDKVTGKAVRLFPVKSRQELATRTVKGEGFDKLGIEGGLYADGQKAYIAVPGALDRYRIHIAGQNRAVNVEKRRGIQLEGLEINHYGKGEYSTAIFVFDSSDILIQNCHLNYDDSFVYVKGASDRLTIQDCTFTDAILDWPFDLMKGDYGTSGIFEGGAVNVDAKYSGRGLVFRRNRIAGIFDGAHLCPWTVDDARTQETDFYQNQLEGCIDDFLETDGFSRNVRIFDNYMNRSLSGVSLAQALDGPTFVAYNLIANCGMVAAAQRDENYGYPFKTNGGSGMEIGSGPIFMYHNTAHTLDPKSRAMLVKHARWRQITLRNNIWCGRALGLEFWEKSLSPFDFDYDDLYVSDTKAPLVLQAYRTKYMTLDEVRKGLGYLPHGISADPRLTDPQSGKYTLQSGSPCIDAGVAIPGINDGRTRGAAPDMGAYETE